LLPGFGDKTLYVTPRIAMTNWYFTPAWYALIISLGSLVVAVLALRASRRISRSSLVRSLIDRRAAINEAFAKYDVAGPYARHFGIAPDRIKPFTAKAILLFHQINLLHDVYVHGDILGKIRVAAYEKWIGTVLRSWIENDDDLRLVWKAIRDGEDMYGTEFVQWLARNLKIVDRPARATADSQQSDASA
jgi:hypothetical protein